MSGWRKSASYGEVTRPAVLRNNPVHKPRRTFPETYVNAAGKTVPMEISVPVNIIEDIIQQELKCPICLGTIQNTSSVTACLHRFCSDCLHKSLRGNFNSTKQSHDCPSCRYKLPSKRSTRADTDFDDFIQVLTSAMDQYRSNNPSASSATANPPTTITKATSDVVLSSPRLSRQSSHVTTGNDNAEPFDVTQYQRSHLLAVATFRAKQQEKMKEVRLKIAQQQAQARAAAIAAAAAASANRTGPLAGSATNLTSSTTSSTRLTSSSGQHIPPSIRQPTSVPNAVKTPAAVANEANDLTRIGIALFPYISLLHHASALQSDQTPATAGAPALPTASTWKENDMNVISLAPLTLPYLRVPPAVTVLALKQYVGARLNLTPVQLTDLQIVYLDIIEEKQEESASNSSIQIDKSPVRVIVLEDSLTIDGISNTIWRGRGRFLLYYRRYLQNMIPLSSATTSDSTTQDTPISKKRKLEEDEDDQHHSSSLNNTEEHKVNEEETPADIIQEQTLEKRPRLDEETEEAAPEESRQEHSHEGTHSFPSESEELVSTALPNPSPVEDEEMMKAVVHEHKKEHETLISSKHSDDQSHHPQREHTTTMDVDDA